MHQKVNIQKVIKGVGIDHRNKNKETRAWNIKSTRFNPYFGLMCQFAKVGNKSSRIHIIYITCVIIIAYACLLSCCLHTRQVDKMTTDMLSILYAYA